MRNPEEAAKALNLNGIPYLGNVLKMVRALSRLCRWMACMDRRMDGWEDELMRFAGERINQWGAARNMLPLSMFRVACFAWVGSGFCSLFVLGGGGCGNGYAAAVLRKRALRLWVGMLGAGLAVP